MRPLKIWNLRGGGVGGEGDSDDAKGRAAA